ncbi:MAG: MATE family efflux transporter [Blautia sp.]|jgi:multidrug efflux pump
MEENEKIQLFEKTPIPSAVAKLSIPMVFSSLVMVLYNMADTYFVGMLNNPVENAAVALAAPVLLAFNAINNLFGVGTSSMMSRALGRKDYDTVSESSAFGFYCSLISGILFGILCTVLNSPLLTLIGADATTRTATQGYLFWTVSLGAAPAILNVVLAYLVRSEGAALHASIGTMSGCLLNIILDPFFILPWGLNMGAEGAGCATFISNCVACLYFFVLLYVKRGKTFVCVNPKRFHLKKHIIMEICGVGIPASIQNLLNVTGMTILNNFTSAYGADAVAAMGISYKIYMVPMQITLGFSQGIMPLVSYNFSSGNRRRMKSSILFAMKIMLPILAAVTVFYYIGADGLIHAFMKNSEIIAYGTAFLRGFCLGLIFLCVDFLAVGVFQALGIGKYALLFAIMRKIVLEIPALFLLNHFFPLYGLAYAQFTAELVLSICAAFMLRHIFRKYQDTKGTAVQ